MASRDRRVRRALHFLLDDGLGIPGGQLARSLAEAAAQSIAAVLERVAPPVWCDLTRASSGLVSSSEGSADGFETKAILVRAVYIGKCDGCAYIGEQFWRAVAGPHGY